MQVNVVHCDDYKKLIMNKRRRGLWVLNQVIYRVNASRRAGGGGQIIVTFIETCSMHVKLTSVAHIWLLQLRLLVTDTIQR